MKPTAKLRFVEREQAIGQMITHRKVLQQWYVPIGGDRTSDHYLGEWRDVPTEQEQA